MKTLIYAAPNDYSEFMTEAKKLPCKTCLFDFIHFDDYDELRRTIAESCPKLIVVYCDGAHGMEICIGIRKLAPEVPLFWFSDDDEFGPQSYRLGCTYFGIKPVTVERLGRAIERFVTVRS